MKKQLIRFGLWHLALAALALGMVLFRLLSQRMEAVVGFRFPTCITHDLLHLYCPFCGGTRAISRLPVGDVVGALKANAAVVISLPFALYVDIKALVRILRRQPVAPLTRLRLMHFVILFAVFFVLRNVLVLFGIDPTGDFIGTI